MLYYNGVWNTKYTIINTSHLVLKLRIVEIDRMTKNKDSNIRVMRIQIDGIMT